MTKALTVGRRYALGMLSDSGYGVWDATNSQHPIVTYSETNEGWYSANTYFQNAEAAQAQWANRANYVPPATRSHTGSYVGLVVTLVVVALVYYFFHQQHYSNCLIKPGLFEWPSQCI